MPARTRRVDLSARPHAAVGDAQAQAKRLRAKAEAANARLDEIERVRDEARAEPAPERPAAVDSAPRRRFAWWPFGRRTARAEDRVAAMMAELEAVAAGRQTADAEAAERREQPDEGGERKRDAAA